jgi:hypothetical protein
MRKALFWPLTLATMVLPHVGLGAAADEPAAKHTQASDGRSQKDGRGTAVHVAAPKRAQASDGRPQKAGRGADADAAAAKRAQVSDSQLQKGAHGTGVGAGASKLGQGSSQKGAQGAGVGAAAMKLGQGSSLKGGQGTGVGAAATKLGQGPDGRSLKGGQGTGVGAAATKLGERSGGRSLKGGRGLGVGAAMPEFGQLSACNYLYIWAGHVDHEIADFLAVIDFDEDSPGYGRVINTVPLPGPGASFNEPHHMHLSADGSILGCGGLLSVLSGQPGIFFFDMSNPREPRFLFSTSDKFSSITDDFFPLGQGGFLITQMGSANGDAPGRVVEFDRMLRQVGSWPSSPPSDGFNPHGISVRPELNLMMTSDFILPDSTLNVVPGPPVLRNTVRVWDFKSRKILKTIPAPEAAGTMDVKLIPGDFRGRAYTAGMFNGLIYLVDPIAGTATPAFDTSPQGGMPQILQITHDGCRLLTGLFESGRIIMLDIMHRSELRQVAALDLGEGAGPHNIMLMDDDTRLIVTDYFLDEDNFPLANPGKVRLGGDCKVHVLNVTPHSLRRDNRFNLDFSTAFPTGPARPHGIAVR